MFLHLNSDIIGTIDFSGLNRGHKNITLSGFPFIKMAADFDLTKFDDVFLGILQHLGKIEPFLEAVFFFLARRTDFFQLMHNRDDKMGFPPGIAEQIVHRVGMK